MSAPLTLGTAGHVDHGKTALIEALTGVNTDRLPQERARGMSIELGFARLALPSGRAVSVVDVPGHERFVRTMVAGATGIDLFLMVVAADDGPMPQTREHALVLGALGVRTGAVAITKSDLADPRPAAAAARELLPGAEVVATSARTGAGLDELRAALDRAAERCAARAAGGGEALLHVDRAFTVHGAGTVVTGTLWSGEIARGQRVEIAPRARVARVRAVHVHDREVERAQAGRRVAVNLAGVTLDEVGRGDALAAPGHVPRAAWVLDVALDVPPSDEPLSVQVHHGTRGVPARLVPFGGEFWQLRTERPLLARAGDRVVVRRTAPPDTLGGGVVLDPQARKRGRAAAGRDQLARLARGEPEPVPAPPQAPAPAPARELGDAALDLERRLRAAGLTPPSHRELGAAAGELAALQASGRAVRVGRDRHYHRDVLADVQRRVVALCRERGSVTVAALRDELGTGRKAAQALLEHFDAARVTRREGDAHVLRHREPTIPR